MPLYRFNTRDGVSYDDPNGLELPDIEAAGVEAVRYMAELLRDESEEVWRTGELTLTIADATGAELCSLTVVKRGAGAA
ncbi:MAG: hypothetical protein AB1942_23885 [Pseudomonadota bacterium]